jgi:hypothetical protein
MCASIADECPGFFQVDDTRGIDRIADMNAEFSLYIKGVL